MSLIYLVSSDTIGYTDPKLGKILMHSFFSKLSEAAEKPSHILFLERGVQLLLPEFTAFEALKALEEEWGVNLLACVTCLDYYGIKDKIKVGKVSTMPEIIAAMHGSDKVIHI
ncbi:MAG: DsrE family protein [Bacillota bacterium]|nr:DsrE family protein [Bacillota bacterium]MDP4159390.1 DsrE family protein [Bacillota bacterium]